MLKLRAQILELFKKASHEKSPEAEADLILFHTFRREHPALRNLGEMRALSPSASDQVTREALRIAMERTQGTPLQHIIGEQFFFEHDYHVNDFTLIPRPETEILIQEVIEYLKAIHGDKAFRFAELGLGSGILSTEILAHFKNATGVASEVSTDAITLAKANLLRIVGPNFEKRFTVLQVADEAVGFEAFQNREAFDLVISNPPYVSRQDEIEKEVLDYEPHLALFPTLNGEKENPNYFYENFAMNARQLLKPEGRVFFEVPHERAIKLMIFFQQSGFSSIRLTRDLTGRNRVLQAGF